MQIDTRLNIDIPQAIAILNLPKLALLWANKIENIGNTGDTIKILDKFNTDLFLSLSTNFSILDIKNEA